MDDITLYGAGGHCYAAVALINSLGDYKPIVILDDNPMVSNIFEVPVSKALNSEIQTEALCITIGQNHIRKKIAERFSKKKYPSFIHNSVTHYKNSTGKGSVILPGAVLDAGVTLGDFCIVNLNATLAHNVIVGDFCHIAINAAVTGGVVLGEGAFVAASAVILPNLKIGKWATVGAGSVVTRDVPDYAVVYGSPAKIIKYTNE